LGSVYFDAIELRRLEALRRSFQFVRAGVDGVEAKTTVAVSNCVSGDAGGEVGDLDGGVWDAGPVLVFDNSDHESLAGLGCRRHKRCQHNDGDKKQVNFKTLHTNTTPFCSSPIYR